MMGHGSLHRAVRFLWRSRSPAARLVRVVLLPLSALYAGVMAVRKALYAAGLLAVRRLPPPPRGGGEPGAGGGGTTPAAPAGAPHPTARGSEPAAAPRDA